MRKPKEDRPAEGQLGSLFAALSGEHLAKLTLPGGVLGRIAKPFIYLVIAYAIIACGGMYFGFPPNYLLLVLGVLSVMGLLVFWLMLRFADKNPQAALMEGAEFLVHEEHKLLQTKSTAARPVVPAEMISLPQDAAKLLPPEELREPDTLPAPPDAPLLETRPTEAKRPEPPKGGA